MAKPARYDLKANIPVDLRLGKIYQNDGNHGPYIRVLAWIREPEETEYVHRSFLSNYELLEQFYQMGYAEQETKVNDDGLPYVNTVKEGESDVLRLVLEEKHNERSGKRYTQAVITHFWDGQIWQVAPESNYQEEAPPEPDAVPPGPPATSPPPSPQDTTPPAVTQPGPPNPPGSAAAPAAAPVPAPTSGKKVHDAITIGYNYHIARCLVQAAGVTGDAVAPATTTVFIEVMKNRPEDPSKWYRTLFENAKEAVGDDGLPF